MSFLFSAKKEKISLILHIDSASVAGEFVLFSEGKKPKILKNIRLSEGVDKKNKSGTQFVSMTKSLDSVLAQLLKEKIKIDTVSVVVGEPWCTSKLKKIHISHDKKFIITESFLAEVLSKEADEIKKELEAGAKGEEFEEMEVIEKNILHTEVNGYDVENSIGLQTNILDLSIHMSFMPKKVLDALLQTIFSHTHISAGGIEVRSFLFVSFFVLKNISQESLKKIPSNGFLTMNVSGEGTEMSLSQSGVLLQTTSFPLGENYIIRQISKSLDVSPEIGYSTLRIVLSGKMDKELTDKVHKVIEGIEKEWQIYFEDALLSLDPRLSLPTKIFLLAPDYAAPLYTEFMTIPKTDATAIFRKKATIVIVDNELLAALSEKNAQDIFDAHLTISALFYKK